MADLTQIILDTLQAAPNQQITFAEYMALALYHPQLGYYTEPGLGMDGDFVTSAHIGHDFGELLAEQFAQLWDILGQPDPFHLVELGPGQGLVAADILRQLATRHPHCLAASHYFLVEQSAGLRSLQQRRLETWAEKVSLTWCELAELPEVTGCIFSNELVDALPVHLVEVQGGQLQEVFVRGLARRLASSAARPNAQGSGEQGKSPFTEALAEISTGQIAEYFQRVEINLLSGDYPDGYRTEVNLAAMDLWGELAAKLRQGYLLTIDYGYPAHRYYSPRRAGGTLQCYHRHRCHSDPYIHVGQQDITAHVDFTALEKRGEELGMRTVGFTQQALFLMALGLGDRIATLSQTAGMDLSQLLQRRETLRQLTDPTGLGNFGVLMQGQGLTPTQQSVTPQGFVVPKFGAV